MGDGKGTYKPRSIDRVFIGYLSVINMLTGLYCVGPWYLDVTDGQKSTVLALVSTGTGVVIYGIMLFLTGLALAFAAVSKGGSILYSRVIRTALLSGFLLRLYAYIGGILILHDWRPPTYVAASLPVLALGSYWIWVRVNERTP